MGSLIAPKFKDLTPQQRAKDAQFSFLKNTLLDAVSKILFGSKDKDEFNIVFDKYCSLIEGLIPIEGFINGLDYPTPADLAVVNICEGYMPFGAAYKITELNFDVKF